MIVHVLTALQIAAAQAPSDPARTYHGRLDQIEVEVPRHAAAEAEIDGVLDEPVWAEAAVLTGFSQYRPVDGQPAADSTEVRVWYSSHAIHLGVRAFEPHAPVNATLADRDKIFDDDNVRVLLDTFDDKRRAFLFAVNPLGVQADGIYSEEGGGSGAWFSGEAKETGRTDLSPDFLFESRGRATDYGYEVEVRIPFKSIRYGSADVQRWGINVLRDVKHSGQEQTWTAARRGETSFLAQSGALTGLADLRRGLVLDLNPVATQQIAGAPVAGGGWDYTRESTEYGLNARWGITTNLTLNGTVNPDFSQVEADVAQIAFDPRQAVSFPEKRPFFLEGSKQFSTPGGIIYTRRIADPVAAAKLTGKVSGTEIGFLSAVDETSLSRTGTDHPVYTILRVRRDVGAQSALGVTYTDRVEGGLFNRVGSVDGRLVLGGAYTVRFQAAASADNRAGDTAWAPLWDLGVERAGREFGWNFSLRGIAPGFRPGSGFIPRPGVVYGSVGPRWTFFPGAGSKLASASSSIGFNNTWLYDRFTGGEMRPDEAKLHFNNTLVFRGGWRLGASLLIENFLYPEDLYRDYTVERRTAAGVDTVAFTGTESINNYDLVLSFGTPQFPTFSANGFVLVGRDENYPEWAPGYIVWADLGASWRPTEGIRVDPSYNETRVVRPGDRSVVSLVQIPRLRLEYQISRPLFVRLVGQYVARMQDDLRDDSRTGDPILIRDPATGVYEREGALAWRRNGLRFDWLLSYQPNPGTVVFAGYGSSLGDEARAFRFGDLERQADGFFVKVSYCSGSEAAGSQPQGKAKSLPSSRAEGRSPMPSSRAEGRSPMPSSRAEGRSPAVEGSPVPILCT